MDAAAQAPRKSRASGAAAVQPRGFVAGPGGPTDDAVPARLSAGEYVLPADTVQAVGVEQLDALRAATHTPLAGEAQDARRMFFAGGSPGGVQPDEEKRRPISPSNIYPQGHPSAGANVYGNVGFSPDALGSSGKFAKIDEGIGRQPGRQPERPNSFGDAAAAAQDPTVTQVAPAQPAASAPPVNRVASPSNTFPGNRLQGASGFSGAPVAPATPASATTLAPQSSLAGQGAAEHERPAAAPGTSVTAPAPQSARPAPPDAAQIASDREAFKGAARGFMGGLDNTMRAAGDVLGLPVRAVAGAADTALIRPARAAGFNVPYLSPHLVPPGADPASMTPFMDKKRMAASQAAVVPGAPGAALDAPNPTDRRLAAGTQTAPLNPSAAPAPASADAAASQQGSYGVIGDRASLTNEQAAIMNPAGRITATRGANGTMEFSGSNVSGQVSYNDANGQALPGGGLRGRGFSNFDVAPAGSHIAFGPNGSYAFAERTAAQQPADGDSAAATPGGGSSRHGGGLTLGDVPIPAGFSSEQAVQYAKEVQAAQANQVRNQIVASYNADMAQQRGAARVQRERDALVSRMMTPLTGDPKRDLTASQRQGMVQLLQQDSQERQSSARDAAGMANAQLQAQAQRYGYDSSARTADARNQIDGQRLGLEAQRYGVEAQAKWFDIRAGQRREGALAKYDAAQTPDEQAAVMKRFPDVFKTEGQKMEVVRGSVDPSTGKREGDYAVVFDPRNGTARQVQVGSGGTAPLPAGQGGPVPPKVGVVQQGYRFKGGDPSQPTSWEKV